MGDPPGSRSSLVHWSGIDHLDVADGFGVTGDLPMDDAVVLRDATFEPVDPSDGDPWYVEEIRFDDAPIGGFAG